MIFLVTPTTKGPYTCTCTLTTSDAYVPDTHTTNLRPKFEPMKTARNHTCTRGSLSSLKSSHCAGQKVLKSGCSLVINDTTSLGSLSNMSAMRAGGIEARSITIASRITAHTRSNRFRCSERCTGRHQGSDSPRPGHLSVEEKQGEHLVYLPVHDMLEGRATLISRAISSTRTHKPLTDTHQKNALACARKACAQRLADAGANNQDSKSSTHSLSLLSQNCREIITQEMTRIISHKDHMTTQKDITQKKDTNYHSEKYHMIA